MTEQVHAIKLLSDEAGINELLTAAADAHLLALDVETAYWWDKNAERLSLIQLAVPGATAVEVWIIDCFAGIDLKSIQQLMINTNIRKVIHNAGFDVKKLRKLANIHVENVYDTMLAAKRAGERGCSLAALAARHLGITLDKRWQRSDWARRPLVPEQLQYAANDVLTTLKLYHHQLERGFNGYYRHQGRHVLHEEHPQITIFEQPVRAQCAPVPANETAARALLQIVAQFPGRYSPQSLANCLGRERGGLPGWIVDQAITKEAFVDYQEALTIIFALVAEGRLVDRGRRLSVSASAFQK